MEPIRETRSAKISLHQTGCIVVRLAKGVTQSVSDAQENVRTSADMGGGPRERPLLVDIRETEPLVPEVRSYYTGGALEDHFLALALVIEDSPLGHMLGNLFYRMMNRADRQTSLSGRTWPALETRIFTDEESAVEWLATRTR